jgi:hypothetical protein
MGEIINAYKTLAETLKESDHPEELGIDRNILVNGSQENKLENIGWISRQITVNIINKRSSSIKKFGKFIEYLTVLFSFFKDYVPWSYLARMQQQYIPFSN